MQPLKLTAHNPEMLTAPYLEARVNEKFFCIIYADGVVKFDVERDYDKEELEEIIKVQDQFFTIFNSLIQKDEEIEALKEKNKALMKELMLTLNPVNERQ